MLEILSHLSLVGAAVLLLYSIATDLRRFEIPNFIPIALILLFIGWALASELSLSDAMDRLYIAAIVLAIGFVLFVLRVFGGGDAKLLAATALWIAPDQMLGYCLIISLLGGVLGLVLLLFRRLPLPKILKNIQWVQTQHDHAQQVPYALAISPAAILFMAGILPASAIF